MVNTSKKNQVDSIFQLIEKNPNLLLVKIGKTTHQSLETLRRELRKSDSKIKVIKNTLFEKAINKIALKDKLFTDFKKQFFPLKETTALVTLSNRWSDGLKALYLFSKKDSTLSFKLALLDKNIYDAEKSIQIAQLPSREELIGKIIGSMKSPMSKFVYALKYNTNKLVYILKQKSSN
ncbi:MAG: 50S ribosomal protein L10 [Candidatus Roizmanbacteria bacterium GW2011_GWA2_33_33]|uniref:Large ribosomal subunit protein uL10 n=1 Tax=Candidatus Roizmanbacteria bacterium GW2011_GWA2_33_33 TaxID=1618476 RepID=A0A0G0A145_9BACT|nr:MAG: 50S ribosomal protein L10 [Candidatus Roizmanbacteria bacterium GW2011_GWA2_33_33]